MVERRIFVTGGTGAWGRQVLHQLRQAGYSVTALVLPTEGDREIARELAWSGLRIVEGDLTNLTDIQAGISDAEVVLHLGAVVSPLADEHPALARQVNVGAMLNIVRAVEELPDPRRVAIVGIGSVAETGNRTPPVHWGRIGDPLRVSHFDEYGQTKVVAERILADSGLPRWVWLRQTGILHSGLFGTRDPIATHTTLGGVLEWVTAEDSARLLVSLCDPAAPEEVWGDIWNIGGGEPWRLTNWEFHQAAARAIGIPDISRWYNRNWFATQNFHGHWFSDSDRLQELVPFRQDTPASAFSRAAAAASRSSGIARRIPAWLVKRLVTEPMARRPRGTLAYVAEADDEGVNAFFGSRAQWEAIGDWSTFVPPAPSRVPEELDHGYDETKDCHEWTRDDLAGAADFRGGRLLETSGGTFRSPALWRCAEGHEFTVSAFLVLRGGHWCPTCIRDTTAYSQQAERNPFLAQIEQAPVPQS